MRTRNHEPRPGALGAVLLGIVFLFAPACSPADDHGPDEDSHQGGSDHEDDHDDGHEDDHDDGHDDEHIELTQVQMEAAGITVERAEAGEVARILTLPAFTTANADAVTHVNPKAPGIVRSIHAHLGEIVEEGNLLCVIDSVELGMAVAEFVKARALVLAAENTLEREGELFVDRLETAERVLQGAVEVNQRIYAREKELREKEVSTIRPLLEAEKALENSKLNKDRDLTDLRAERDTRILALEVILTERRISRDGALNALLALGVDSASLEKLEPGSPLLAGTYEIRAPRGGVVAGRHLTTGEFVDAETKLYTLEDLSRMWIVASVFEGQLQSIRKGQEGRIHLDAFPDHEFHGQITMVGYEVDPASRALGVRLELQNSRLESWPEEFPVRPGMFGSVDMVVDRIQARVVLPESAIVHDGELDYVFVMVAPGTFEQRHVQLADPTGETVEVREGVEPGEEVAVTGTFQLKSAQRQGELGGGHSH